MGLTRQTCGVDVPFNRPAAQNARQLARTVQSLRNHGQRLHERV